MKSTKMAAGKGFLALLLALSLSACGGESPEAMLASAKDYLVKNDPRSAEIQLKNALQENPNLAEARFLLAKMLLDQGNVAGADVEIRKVANLNYPEDKVVPLQARVMLLLGQSDKVIANFADTQLVTPEGKAELQATLGDAHLAQGKLDAALGAFANALAIMPGYGPALFGQARIKAAGNDVPGALALLDSALQTDPRLFQASQLKGDLLAYLGEIQQAMGIYRQTIEQKPDYLPAYVSLVSRLMESGQLEEAEKQFGAMRKIAPGSLQTAYVRSELLYRQKRFSEAREAIQQLLRVAPDSVQGQQLAGAIDFELRDYVTAERYLQAVVPKLPRISVARRILIASYLRCGKPDKALGILEPILAEIDNNSNLLALAGEVFMQNGDVEKANSYFSRSAALDPNNKGKQTAVALTHLALGKTDTAYQELEKIASTDASIRADMALIASQLRNHKFDLALKSIDTLERKRAGDPLIAPLIDNLRGTALIGKRDMEGARMSFERALTKNPEYFPAVANLARMDIADRKPDEAKRRFEDLLARDPRNPSALLALAELKARTGAKAEEVLAMLVQSVAANPTDVASRLALINFYIGAKEAAKAVEAAQEALGSVPGNPLLIDAEGKAQQAAKNYNQALSAYAKLSEQNPNDIRPYLRMAEIHVAAKDTEKAMQSLRRALIIKPDSIEAERGVIMLHLQAGRVADAVATARDVQRQYPKNPIGYLLEGDSQAVNKNWKAAEQAYREGIRQTGATELAMGAHAALRAQNSSDADRFAATWIKDHPKDQRFRFYLAESATARGDFPTAIRYYRALLDGQPDNPALLNNLAWVMAQNKDPKALDMAERAYKLAPDQANIADTFGSLLVERGGRDDLVLGLDLLRKARALNPNNPMIQFNLANALVKSGSKAEAKPMLIELSTLGTRFARHAEVGKLLEEVNR
jgi:putative PEP-CTERM system TPR-repeat lipoprotein